MKIKYRNELRELDVKALKGKARELSAKTDILRFDRFSSQPKNSREIRNLLREKAVILTIIREKEQVHG